MRIIFSYILSILLIWQPAEAVKNNSISWKQIIEETGLNKKNVRLDEIYFKYHEAFPLFLQGHIEELLRLEPDLLLPNFNIYTISNKNGEEDLQISYTDKYQSINMTFLTEEKIIKVGSERITFEDWVDGISMQQKLEKGTGIGSDWAWLISSDTFKVKLIEFKEFQALANDEKENYIFQIRDIVRESELFSKTINTSKKTSWFFPFLLETASAEVKEEDKCLVAGQISVFKKNGKLLQCGYDDANISCLLGTEKGVRCNPSLYGTGKDGEGYCVSSMNASEECNKFEWFPKNESEWNEMKLQLDSVLKLTENNCEEFSSEKQAHQSCMLVLQRVDEIKKQIESKSTEEKNNKNNKKKKKELSSTKVKWYRKPWVLLTVSAAIGGIVSLFLWNWLSGSKSKKNKNKRNLSPYYSPGYYLRGKIKSRKVK